MNLLHVTDLGNGQIQVSWQRGKEIARNYVHPIPFSDPLSVEDRRELRWYLEEYLDFPYGAEEYRAQKVVERMVRWGESLFEQVFINADSDPDPRGFYQEAVHEGLDRCELCITSEDAAFLNIPWELMRDATPGRGYLAQLLAGLYRHRTGHTIQAPSVKSPGEPFRILLVIARPYGEADVALGTVARPMLEALRPFRSHIQLELLRPPTFDEFQKRLNDRPGYYDLVHFDGHGDFVPSSSGGSMSQLGATAGSGCLVFEKKDATPHVVHSEKLGQMLAGSRVPFFVLNACRSAEEGEAHLFSSIASQLVAVGAKGVVAMSYSVYAVTAALFIERFYERLVQHASLAEAVAEARRRLYAEPDRSSVVGPLELQDWMVPALYQQEFRFVPIPESTGAVTADEKEEGAEPQADVEETCPEGRFGFIGRDYDLVRLERALCDDDAPWALITGIGGIGKTELARGFARWYFETGGCPRGVFFASFKEKANFGQVIGSIAGFGTDFSRLSDEEQWKQLIAFLKENPCLLVWDNFEPVAGYPPGEVPLANDEERDKLSRFLKALKGGRSRVIITTRKPDEDWLGIGYTLLEMRGLNERDAGQLAKEILRTVGKKPEDFRQDPDYARLIRLLNGHPRSLEVVLPQLRRRSPSEIIEALQHRTDQLGEAIEDASLSEAFEHLSPKARKHLPFIGLFASYVDADTLGNFVGAGDEQEQAYSNVMGEALDAAGWEEVLDEAASSGMIRLVGARVYELHPTLPAFLRRQLAMAVGEDGVGRLDIEFMKFYAAWAAYHHEDATKADRIALAAVTVEETNLLRAVRLAEGNEEWKPAQAIVQTLCKLYEARARTEESRALCARLLGSVGREISADADRDRSNLWMFLLGEEANDAFDRNELANAENAYQRVVDYLISLDDPSVEPKIAVCYHQLGLVAQERQKLDQAEVWYRKALEIKERLGLEQKAASDYHHLGRSGRSSTRPRSGTGKPGRFTSAWVWNGVRPRSTTIWG